MTGIHHRLQALTQTEFPEFIAELWTRQGWQTELVGDYDVYITGVQTNSQRTERIYIKPWRLNSREKIQATDITALAKPFRNETTCRRQLVTTTEFTTAAQQVATDRGIDLINAAQLAHLIHTWGAQDLLEEFVP